MGTTAVIFKRATIRDPQDRRWAIVVEDRIDPNVSALARAAAETFGRYAMTIVAPDGRTAEVLVDANVVQVDSELARYADAIATGAWTAELAPLAAEPTPSA